MPKWASARESSTSTCGAVTSRTRNYQAFYFESFNQSFIQKGKPFQIGGEITVTF